MLGAQTGNVIRSRLTCLHARWLRSSDRGQVSFRVVAAASPLLGRGYTSIVILVMSSPLHAVALGEGIVVRRSLDNNRCPNRPFVKSATFWKRCSRLVSIAISTGGASPLISTKSRTGDNAFSPSEGGGGARHAASASGKRRSLNFSASTSASVIPVDL